MVEFLGRILNSTFFTRGSTTLKYSVHRTCCCLGSSCLFGWIFEEALELITILRRSEAGDYCEIWPPWMLEKHQVIGRKRGCWSLGETSTNGLPSFYWSPCDSWAAFCAVGVKITSPYEKFIPNRKDIHHSGCTLSSSTSPWINF